MSCWSVVLSDSMHSIYFDFSFSEIESFKFKLLSTFSLVVSSCFGEPDGVIFYLESEKMVTLEPVGERDLLSAWITSPEAFDYSLIFATIFLKLLSRVSYSSSTNSDSFY